MFMYLGCLDCNHKIKQKQMKNLKSIFTVLLLLLQTVVAIGQVVGTPIPVFKKKPVIDIPATLTLGQDYSYFIASAFDQDYLPYTSPTSAAVTTAVAADGTNEAVAVDVQGVITTSGFTYKIPISATGSGTLPAYSTNITIDASLTEDGISRDLNLSWASQSYTTSTKSIIATIKAVGGTLNIKKLDINGGIGDDVLGILLGTFSYPYDSFGSNSYFSIRAISGIPDKKFGLADNGGAGTENRHQFLYLPIEAEDGNIWLNNNLGANYTNVNSASFNPNGQATSRTDTNAYGNMFQWGRPSDGHDLITYTTATLAAQVNGETLTQNDAPTDALFIKKDDWRVNSSTTLWASETSTNNPCPYGFRVPSLTEWSNYITAANINNHTTAAAATLKITIPGFRTSSTGQVDFEGQETFYWSNTNAVEVFRAMRMRIYNAGTQTSSGLKGDGYPIRCIKDNTPAATVTTLNCAGATHTGTLKMGLALSNLTTSVPYSGGNSGKFNQVPVNSTGVTGLTATLAPGLIGTSGNLVFSITGTPSGPGTASFPLTFGGQSCTFTRTVDPAATFSCGNTIVSTNDWVLTNGNSYTGTIAIPYTAGNTGQNYPAETITANGITFTRNSGTYAASGNMTYSFTGTFTGTSNTVFDITVDAFAGGCTIPIFDAIRGALAQAGCTSCTNYDAAAIDNAVAITKSEYDKIALILGAGKSGLSDATIATDSANPQSFSGNNTLSTNSNSNTKIPASNYIMAFQVRTWSSSVTSMAGMQLKTSATHISGYTNYGGTTPSTGSGNASTNYYFVFKRPTAKTAAGSDSFFAIYIAQLGQVQTYPIGTGTSYNSNSNSNSFASAYPTPFTLYAQTLSTATKQW